MKKWILWALCLSILTGCASDHTDEEAMKVLPEITLSTTQPSAAAEFTDAAEAMEIQSPAEQALFCVLIHPQDTDFVRVSDYIPDVVLELKYATADNFTSQVIYDFEEVFLRYGTVRKLQAAAEELAEQGLRLKIWDGFRPVSTQFRLWEICPDPTYVANPNKGYSNHSRGFAVDLTIVDEQGNELEMPTAFDDFSAKADRDYSDCTQAQADNARLLQSVMEKHGFQGYWGEWWHFNDSTHYEVETCFDPGAVTRRYAAVDTPLLSRPETGDLVLTIPAGEGITVLGWKDDYAMAEYWGYRGYVALTDLRP